MKTTEHEESLIEAAAQAMKDEDAAPIGIDHYRRLARVAAPLLQLPWPEPSVEEVQSQIREHGGHNVLAIVRGFVRYRNAGVVPVEPCCERDTDGDGNCPIHCGKGIFRNPAMQIKPIDPRVATVRQMLVEWHQGTGATASETAEAILAKLDGVVR